MSVETQRVYEAEWVLRDMLKLPSVNVCGREVAIPVERNFASIESIQTYVDKVLALNWIRDMYPHAQRPLKVVKKPKGRNVATCGGGIMYVPINSENRWALREQVILHEMAHHLTPGCSHGGPFRDCLAWLLEEIVAPEVGWLMRTLFWDRGLTCVQPAPMVVR